MEIIIDNNILFSLMNPVSIASKIIKNPKLELSAPTFIKEEFTKHEEICKSKSGLKEDEFSERKKEIESKINFIELEDYYSWIEPALKLIQDQDDVPYLALALAYKLPIWSNDSDLKEQSTIPVFTTTEIIELI